jgi:hypothetical protein
VPLSCFATYIMGINEVSLLYIHGVRQHDVSQRWMDLGDIVKSGV